MIDLSDDTTRAVLSGLAQSFPEEGQCDACRQYDDTVYDTDCQHFAVLQLCESCHDHYCPDGGECW